MKYFIIACAFFVMMAACRQSGSGKSGAANKTAFYTINGKIDGIDTGWIYLLHRQSDLENVDSSRITNGSFTFRGATNTPEFCMLGVVNNGHKEFRLGFFAESGQLNITGQKDAVSAAVITGSPAQDEYYSFITSRKPLDEEQEKLGKLYENANARKDKRVTDSLDKVFDVYEKKEKDFIKTYARRHPSSYVAALQVYQHFSYNPDAKELDTIYSALDHSIQSSYFGKKIKESLDIAKKTAIGNAAPEFALNDMNGKSIALSSFKGRYVLVDFWASWCGPCRRENPAVVQAYHQYHAKGFDIFGVSLDDKKDKWAEAIKNDKLSWTQVSDLKGWQNSAAQLYGVQGIPMNFLLDKEGNIIGKGLRGEDLEKKLAEVVK